MHGLGLARAAVLIQLPADLAEQVARALREDVGSGDVTASLIPAATAVRAQVLCRQPAVLCGTAWFDETFRQLNEDVRIDWRAHDADAISAGTGVCQLHGPARAVLTGERTALNFLQLLSATATVTHAYVEAIAGTACQILDTRKTIPGLRTAQKYAVRCGGGSNHRLGLFDLVLVKENHIAAAGSIAAAILAARREAPELKIEVETEDLGEFQQALEAGADIIMLDDFDLAPMRAAVELNRAAQQPALLEASGGVTLENVRAVALTGVDFISVGSITKHVQAVDLSMRFDA